MSQTGSSQLDTIIQDYENNGARIGVFATMPDGSSFSHRGNERFISASTIKIAIMVELYRRIDAGDFSLDQPYVLTESDRTPGSGVLHEMHEGLELTLRDVLYLMMSISDNSATNILIDLVGIDNVNRAMRDLGLTESVLNRKMLGGPSDRSVENYSTPNEFASLIGAILDGSAASTESCVGMVEILKLQANSRRIGRFVPAGWEWGSKTGSHTRTVNDVGFVMTDAGPLIVSIYCEDMPDVVAGEIAIAEITRALMGVSTPD